MSKVTVRVLTGISLFGVLMLSLVACTSPKPTSTPIPTLTPITPVPMPTPTPDAAAAPTPTLSPLPTPSPTPVPVVPAPKPTGPIKAKWIKAERGDNTASIAVNEVRNNKISHFAVGTSAGNISFMAYELENRLYVRADICPPCRSESFSLKKDTLVCDVCGTVFDAKTGAGVEGGCVAFPKAAVPYEIVDGKMVMKGADLITAYRETLRFRPQG